MRKLCYIAVCLAAIPAAVIAATFCGCKKTTDYADYISEMRYDIFTCADESADIKIYCSKKESPYLADGIKSNVNELIEIYAGFGTGFDVVTISSDSFTGGEMSYLTVKDCWYLSFSGTITSDSVTVTVICDDEANSFTLESVLTDQVMSCEEALDYVLEYDGELFSSKTENGVFRGEIFIRLLYDGNCYYYVGVCGRDGKINAHLLDGESGKIIAEREHTM